MKVLKPFQKRAVRTFVDATQSDTIVRILDAAVGGTGGGDCTRVDGRETCDIFGVLGKE